MGFNMIDLYPEETGEPEAEFYPEASAIISKATKKPLVDISSFRPSAYVGDSKARRDVIHGRLPAGKVILLAGAGGSGKSTLLLQIAESIHSGSDCLGSSVSGEYRGSSCILILGEDSRDTLDLRLQVIRKEQGYTANEFQGLYIACPDLEHSARLVIRDDYTGSIIQTEMFTWLESAIEHEVAVNGKVGLVAIDTFTALLGIDVNCPADVQGCYNLFSRLAKKWDCCVLICHHLNKGHLQGSREKIRGSTAVVDGVRASYVLTPVADNEAATMLKVAGLEPGLDLLKITLEKDNLGLSRRPVYLVRKSDGYLKDVSHLIGDAASPAESLLGIIKGFNDTGQVVRKSGSQGLFSLRADDWPKALQSRDRLATLANGLIQAGRLSDGVTGLHVVEA